MKHSSALFIESVAIENPESDNLIIGQSHFIKTVEDIHEALVSSVPNIRFGLAFSEASGPRKIRSSGTDTRLQTLAEKNLLRIGCGHSFILFMGNAFPINILHAIRRVPEIVTLYCATANPTDVLVVRTERGGAILGVVDGFAPVGIENRNERKARSEFLRKIGYKLDIG
jgi:hypothetical protein